MDPYPALCQLLEELIALNRQVPVVVEGKRDVQALRTLGLTGQLREIHCGQPIIEVARQLSRECEAIILLPDWDRRGEQLFKRLREHLTCDVDESFRRRLEKLTPPDLFAVEDLPGYLANLQP